MKSMKMAQMTEGEVVPSMAGFSSKGLADNEAEEKEEYPYCLRMYLGPEEMKKLGFEKLPNLGSKLNIQAVAKVIGLRECEDGPCMDIQITDMDMKQESKEKKKEQVFYGESEE